MKLRKRISFATLDAFERQILSAFERPGRRRFMSKIALAKLNAKLRAAARATLQELCAQKGSLAMPKQQLTRNPAKR